MSKDLETNEDHATLRYRVISDTETFAIFASRREAEDYVVCRQSGPAIGPRPRRVVANLRIVDDITREVIRV